MQGKIFVKKMLPMLKLDTNYGFHELFLNLSKYFALFLLADAISLQCRK